MRRKRFLRGDNAGDSLIGDLGDFKEAGKSDDDRMGSDVSTGGNGLASGIGGGGVEKKVE